MKKIIEKIPTKYFLYIIGILVIILFYLNIGELIVKFEDFSIWLFPSNPDSRGELFKIFLNIFGALGILFGLYVSLRRAKAVEKSVEGQIEATNLQSKQIEITRKAQTDERFKNAVEHLGSDKEPVILGGIAELNQIATENTDEYAEVVFKILCSYIKSKANLYKNSANEINYTVIQTIIDNLFKSKKHKNTFNSFSADLRHTNLYGVDFSNSSLTNIDLSLSYIRGMRNVNFDNCSLNQSVLGIFDFENVKFNNTNLYLSIFNNCSLKECQFNNETKLMRTKFISCEIINTTFNNKSIYSSELFGCLIENSTFSCYDFMKNKILSSSLKQIIFNKSRYFLKNDFRASNFIDCKFENPADDFDFKGCSSDPTFSHFEFLRNIESSISINSDLKGLNFVELSEYKSYNDEEFTSSDYDELKSLYEKAESETTIKGTNVKGTTK